MSPPYGSELSLPDVEQRLHEVKTEFEGVKSRYTGAAGFFRGLFGLRSADQNVLDRCVESLSLLYAHGSLQTEVRDVVQFTGRIEDSSAPLRREIRDIRQDIRDYIVEFDEDDDLHD